MSNTVNYDFTTAANKAFGSNQVSIGSSLWAIYSGDINSDLSIDVFDYLLMEPDIVAGNGGYLATDLNGDGGVDAFDYLVVENALVAGVTFNAP